MFTLSSFFKVYLFGVVCGAAFMAAVVFLPALVYRIVGWSRRFRAFVRRHWQSFASWYLAKQGDFSGILFVSIILAMLLVSLVVFA